MNPISDTFREKFCGLSVVEKGAHVSSEQIDFLMKTGLANKIALFCNTTCTGRAEHQIKIDPKQGLMIKKENVWCALQDVMNDLQWDPQRDKLVSKYNCSEVWSYQSPEGLVARDPFHYGELRPIGRLDAGQYEALQERAKLFWRNHDEVDVGELKSSILQIITTKKLKKPQWYLEAAYESFPQHTTVRLIDPQYNLYSFGVQMEKGVPGGLCQDSGLDCLAETKARISSMDYEEAKGFEQKTITTIPITDKRLLEIIAFVSDTNRAGYRFRMLPQNCTTFGKFILEKAGITSIPRKITPFTYIAGLFPRLESVPVIGKEFTCAMERIHAAVDHVWKLFDRAMPRLIQRVIFMATDAVTFVPLFLTRKIGALVSNTIMKKFGSDIKKEGSVLKKVEDRGWSHLFDEEACMIDSHTALFAWQEKQASTVFRRYEGKRMIYL